MSKRPRAGDNLGSARSRSAVFDAAKRQMLLDYESNNHTLRVISRAEEVRDCDVFTQEAQAQAQEQEPARKEYTEYVLSLIHI